MIVGACARPAARRAFVVRALSFVARALSFLARALSSLARALSFLAHALVVFGLLGLASGLVHALDANTASVDELQTIRGIGPATATRIVEARHGEPFRDLDDLRERVRGIGEKNLRKMQDAGLAVGNDHVVERTGRARVVEPAATKRDNASTASKPDRGARAIEWYVGRPR